MDKKALLKAKKAELADLKAKLAEFDRGVGSPTLAGPCDYCNAQMAPGAGWPESWVAGSGEVIKVNLCDKCHDQWVQDRATS